MKVTIDTEASTLTVERAPGQAETHGLYQPQAFAVLSHLWLKCGWDLKYSYDFKWLGRPFIQMPEDMVRLQEIIWETRPTVVVETGVAHGGSAVFFASLMQILGRGKVVSVELELRPHNRAALQAHPLFERINIIEGSSVDTAVVEQVKATLAQDDRVMVVLDSNHTREHVARELELFAPLVSPGCHLLVADGVMSILDDVTRGKPSWKQDNPLEAAREFLRTHPAFEMDPVHAAAEVTYFQGGWLRRR